MNLNSDSRGDIELSGKKGFLQRRWSDFRQGHNTYFAYFLGFTNFSILVYEFVLKNIPLVLSIFPTIFHFLAAFIVCYLPLAAVVGWFHRRYQMPIDLSLSMKQNPYWREMARSLAEFEQALLLIAQDKKDEAIQVLHAAIQRLEMDFA